MHRMREMLQSRSALVEMVRRRRCKGKTLKVRKCASFVTFLDTGMRKANGVKAWWKKGGGGYDISG